MGLDQEKIAGIIKIISEKCDRDLKKFSVILKFLGWSRKMATTKIKVRSAKSWLLKSKPHDWSLKSVTTILSLSPDIEKMLKINIKRAIKILNEPTKISKSAPPKNPSNPTLTQSTPYLGVRLKLRLSLNLQKLLKPIIDQYTMEIGLRDQRLSIYPL